MDQQNVEADLEAVKAKIAAVETEIAAVKTKLAPVETEIAAVKTKIAAVETEVDRAYEEGYQVEARWLDRLECLQKRLGRHNEQLRGYQEQLRGYQGQLRGYQDVQVARISYLEELIRGTYM
jgi:septal ring factor EnvC (AmiA/AmiB activator)